MNKHQILDRDLQKTIRKIVIAMQTCNVTPEGTLTVTVKVPVLQEDESVIVSEFTCDVSEMRSWFEDEEIKFKQQGFNPEGVPIPEQKTGRIFGKKVVSRMLKGK